MYSMRDTSASEGGVKRSTIAMTTMRDSSFVAALNTNNQAVNPIAPSSNQAVATFFNNNGDSV